MATEHFQSPLYGSGTFFCSISRLLRNSVTSRLLLLLKDILLRTMLPVITLFCCRAREVTLPFMDTLIALNYLLTSLWLKIIFVEFYCTMFQVVLCFSPVGSALRIRSRKFPALANCTNIDWFHEWPEEALLSVSQKFLSEVELLTVGLD